MAEALCNAIDPHPGQKVLDIACGPDVNSPLHWGTDKGIQELLGQESKSIKSQKRKAIQYYLSADHAVNIFSTWFGPTLRALEESGEDQGEDLLSDLKKVFNRYNRSPDNTAIIENTYLQTIVYV